MNIVDESFTTWYLNIWTFLQSIYLDEPIQKRSASAELEEVYLFVWTSV